jgi:hypothetical protein
MTEIDVAEIARRLSGDRGVVGGVEVVPFGVLVFVVGSLLVANAWAVVDAKLMVTSAAREAARAYVEAPDGATAVARARANASDAIIGHGHDPRRVRLRVDHEGGQAWGRCVRVGATAEYPIPALSLPWIGGYGHTFDVTARHSELIDPYRAGLPGPARC